jgi:hypothetical protein
VNGRLISLPSPPVRDGRAWYVPVDFVRALAPAFGGRLELRKPSRLILAGDIRVPRIVGRMEALGSLARLTLDISPGTPHTVTQEGTRLSVRFEADSLDAALPATTSPELVVNVRPGDGPAAIAIDLGPRFSSFRTVDTPGDRGAARLVIDVAAQTTEVQPGTPAPTTSPAPAAPPSPEAPPLIDPRRRAHCAPSSSTPGTGARRTAQGDLAALSRTGDAQRRSKAESCARRKARLLRS